MKSLILLFVAALSTLCSCQHPADFAAYHVLHARPPPPPRAPVAPAPPPPAGACAGRGRGLHADVSSGCQAYLDCWRDRLIGSGVCPSGTLFNEQFQVCDHFYNVRCGSPYEDL